VELENQLKMIMFSIPNILDSEHNVLGESTIGVPFGEDENKNIEVRRMYEPRKLDFTPLPH
jgi:seryl-tRNA synthetase